MSKFRPDVILSANTPPCKQRPTQLLRSNRSILRFWVQDLFGKRHLLPKLGSLVGGTARRQRDLDQLSAAAMIVLIAEDFKNHIPKTEA
ncbi:MAG: hypothetical protein R2688_00135 [Fimbriimonadaceae bacterium]